MTDIESATPVEGKVTPSEDHTPPQFTADYWRKAPRKLTPATRVMAINNLPNGDKEFVCISGARTQRPAKDVKQLITPGTDVQIEFIQTSGGQLVTGMYLPAINGWAWKMDAEELAEYTKGVAAAVKEQRMQVKLLMVAHLKQAMLDVLNDQPRFTKLGDEAQGQLAEELACAAVAALETGPQ